VQEIKHKEVRMKNGIWQLVLTGLVPALMVGCPTAPNIAPNNTSNNAQSFNLNVPNATFDLAPGSSITVNVQIERVGGFSDPVALSLDGLNSDLNGTFDTPNTPDSSSTLTLTAEANATPGSRSVTINGTGAGVSKTAPLTLMVTVGSSGTRNLPSIESFTSSTPELSAAGKVELQWKVNDATSLEIEGVGVVSPASTGSVTLNVEATKTLTLKATNADGTSTATTDVMVAGAAALNPGEFDQAMFNEAVFQ
jgi:hypothetical protein